jgi:hypothetical protein
MDANRGANSTLTRKERIMKRFIAVVSFAALAVPAFAAGLPYEQNVVDRALPNVSQRALDTTTSHKFGAPYEQLLIDRALPNIAKRGDDSAASGATRSDIGGSRSPWANDYNFIAPAM